MKAAMVRATMSVEPPAGNGTTKRTGRLGHSCAEPAVGNAIATATAAINAAPIIRRPNIEFLRSTFHRRLICQHLRAGRSDRSDSTKPGGHLPGSRAHRPEGLR